MDLAKVELDEKGIPTKYHEDDIIGSSSGVGEEGVVSRVEQAIDDIVNQIKKVVDENNVIINDITFNCFGFSRGAAAARHFANEVLLPYKVEEFINPSTDESSTVLDTITTSTVETPAGGLLGKKLKNNNIEPNNIEINFIGLFDTVLADSFNKNKIEFTNKFSKFRRIN